MRAAGQHRGLRVRRGAAPRRVHRPVFTLKAWQEIEGFGFDLLSDFWPHGAAARAFGVFDERSGHALRGSFLVDADGIVRWSVVHPRGQRRDLDGYLQALAEI